MRKDDSLPQKLSNSPVLNEKGESASFSSYLRGPTLVIFLRHFGCVGCTSHMTELMPRLQEFHEKGIAIVLIGNGNPHFIQGFKERFALDDKPVTILTDPTLKIYQQFHFKRSLWGAIGFGAMIYIVKSFAKGLFQRNVQGDLSQQGGVLLVNEQKKVEFYHQSNGVGDNADFSEVMEAATRIYLRLKTTG